MGLDMYLEAKLHLPPYNTELAPVRHAIGQAIGYVPPSSKPVDDPTLLEITGVTVRVGYWRKVDPLHQWFVDHVQEGHDDCRPAYVAPDILMELANRLDRVRHDPERAGDDFLLDGDAAMDTSEVDYTLQTLQHAQRLQERGWDIYYRASW